ncbi:iron-containing redox enzyme family protein [Pseudomonas sp. TE3610]
MTVLKPLAASATLPCAQSRDAANVYHDLLHGPRHVDDDGLRAFLNQHLAAAADLPCELPDDPATFAGWMTAKVNHVAQDYAHYLEQRHAGAPRRYFTCKAHALYFLQRVAPTKLVDGAWLYGTLQHTDDWRYHGLIRTYLEELGDGDPALNHVALYRTLLADHDCAATQPLDAGHYVQGAVQLALGTVGDDYLPELIGYNLGYEQLPLHLLITSFELNELGIDPYYFTLHVTIDNASCGHARKAIEAACAFLADSTAPAHFLQRLRAGYNLNELGVGSTAVIQGFDLAHEVVAMLERKREFGQHTHSDYCRLDGKTVNQWLQTPGQIPAFLDTLQARGWIKRHQDPALSRFWQLIDGPGAPMFGVFNGYEQQLLHDWIAGTWQTGRDSQPFRAQFRHRTGRQPAGEAAERLASAPATLRSLVPQLSPAHHATPDGLRATRTFSRMLTTTGAH